MRDVSRELGALHPIWKTVLPCGNAVTPMSCLKWSEEGQLLITTSENLFILTPAIGYMDAPEEYGAHFSTSINIEKELENLKSLDTGNEERATLTAPLQRTDTWITAAWSPRGMGPFASCLLACIPSRGNVRIYAAENDPVRGPWSCVCDVLTQRNELQSRHAGNRSDEAQQLAYTYTCLAWGDGDQHGLLAVGTRGGDLLIWRAPRGKGKAWQFVTSCRLKSGLLQLAWGRFGLAVHTLQSMVLLHYEHDTLSIRQEIPWLPAVSLLSWHGSQVCIVSPYGLYRWDTQLNDARVEKRETSAPYAVGSLGSYVVFNDGTLQDWDRERALHTSWQFNQQPVWGAAQAEVNLVATLVSADDVASWRYRVTRRVAYTLWSISTGSHDSDSSSSLACISELFNEKQSVPILAWRSALLYVMQSPDLTAMLKCLADYLQSFMLTPLLPRCEQLINDQAQSYKQWKQPTAAALSLRWCSAWLYKRYPLKHNASASESQPNQDLLKLSARGASQLANEVTAIASATAAIEAKQSGSYAKRLAAHLILLAESPEHTLKGVSDYLRLLATHLHSETKAWTSRSIDLDEKCAACQAPVLFTLDQYTKCSAGHVFGRFNILTQNDALQPMRYFMQKIPSHALDANAKHFVRNLNKFKAYFHHRKLAMHAETAGGRHRAAR